MRQSFLLVTIAAFGLQVALADEPQPDAKKPPYERLLQGDDATQATELNEKIEKAGQDDQFDMVISLNQELLALRTKIQGADHWETVNERWTLDGRRKLAALSGVMRSAWRKARQGVVEAQEWEAKRRYPEAEPLWKEYHRSCVQVFGENHTETADAAGGVAFNLFFQEKYGEAQPFFRTNLDLRLKLVGEKHPETATAFGGLALNLNARGNYDEAQSLYEKALDICREQLGEKNPGTNASYNNLAMNLNNQGKYAEAQPILQKILDVNLALLGEKHPDTATSYNNLALNLRVQGKPAQAEPLYKKALELRRELFGEKSPLTAQSYNNLAASVNAQGNYRDAQPLYQRSLELRRELLGDMHTDTASTYHNLAYNLELQGRNAEAQTLYQRALELQRELLGESHPETAQTYNGLANNLGEQGKYAEAQPLHEKALEYNRKSLGEKHPATVRVYNDLAHNLFLQEKYEDAEPLFKTAIDLSLEKNADTAATIMNFANNLSAQKKYAEAEPFFDRSFEMLRAVLGVKHPQVAAYHHNVSTCFIGQGRFADAQRHIDAALELNREILGENHPHTSLGYADLGVILTAQKKYVEALPHLMRAATTYEASRLSVASRGLERAVFGAKRSPYQLQAATFAQLRSPAAAWVAAETDLARGLSDETAALRGTALTPEEQNRQVALSTRLSQLQPRILQIVSSHAPSESEKREVVALRAERTALESDLAELSASLSQREVAGLAQVQSAIPADAAVILWLDLSDRGGVFNEHWGCVVRHTGEPKWERLPGSGLDGNWIDDDSDLPGQLLATIASKTSDLAALETAAHELSNQRLAPLTRHLEGVTTLYIAAVNRMAGVPIEVLTRDFTISYIPSGTFLARLSQRDPASKAGLLALGDPEFKRPGEELKTKPSVDLPSGGLLITMVVPRGAAAKAELKPGDVLVRYGDTELNSVEQLTAAIQAGTTAKEVPISVWREGEKEPFARSVPPGRLGVGLNREPARDAIASRRQTDAILASLRGGDWKELPGTRAEITQLSKLFGDETTALLDSQASEQALDELRRRGDLSQFRYLHFATHGATNDVRAFESVLILAQDTLPADPLLERVDPGFQAADLGVPEVGVLAVVLQCLKSLFELLAQAGIRFGAVERGPVDPGLAGQGGDVAPAAGWDVPAEQLVDDVADASFGVAALLGVESHLTPPARDR
jgi:tetratricopeptide (TPR) repeat protein